MSATESAFIDDGMNFDGRLKREAGVHPEITFQYRPATYRDRLESQKAFGDPEKGDAYARKLISDKLVGWNLTEHPSESDIGRLRAAVVSKMVNVILEYAGSDEEEADAKN